MPVLMMEADHNPQWPAPEALVEMFFKASKSVASRLDIQ